MVTIVVATSKQTIFANKNQFTLTCNLTPPTYMYLRVPKDAPRAPKSVFSNILARQLHIEEETDQGKLFFCLGVLFGLMLHRYNTW